MPDLEERTIEDLADRCENCGASLTQAEKETALEQQMTPVLCTVCAIEGAPADELGGEVDEVEY